MKREIYLHGRKVEESWHSYCLDQIGMVYRHCRGASAGRRMMPHVCVNEKLWRIAVSVAARFAEQARNECDEEEINRTAELRTSRDLLSVLRRSDPLRYQVEDQNNFRSFCVFSEVCHEQGFDTQGHDTTSSSLEVQVTVIGTMFCECHHQRVHVRLSK